MNRDWLEQRCDEWIAIFAGLGDGGVPSIESLAGVAEADVRFTDPFNDIRGLEALQKLLEHTRKQVRSVQFEVQDRAWSGNTVYIRWRMRGRVRVIGEWVVEGVSEVEFSEDAKVVCHIDHWDASTQFFGRLPLIGWLLRLLSRPARIS